MKRPRAAVRCARRTSVGGFEQPGESHRPSRLHQACGSGAAGSVMPRSLDCLAFSSQVVLRFDDVGALV